MAPRLCEPAFGVPAVLLGRIRDQSRPPYFCGCHPHEKGRGTIIRLFVIRFLTRPRNAAEHQVDFHSAVLLNEARICRRGALPALGCGIGQSGSGHCPPPSTAGPASALSFPRTDRVARAL